MTTAAFSPMDHNVNHGATALGAHGGEQPRHLIGNALRAAKVFGTAIAEVVLLGQVDEDAGARRRDRERRTPNTG